MEKERRMTLRALGYGLCVTEAHTTLKTKTKEGPGHHHVLKSECPALLLPLHHPFAFWGWLVALEFACGDEGDDCDLLPSNEDFAFAWLELHLHRAKALKCQCGGAWPVPRLVSDRAAHFMGCQDTCVHFWGVKTPRISLWSP